MSTHEKKERKALYDEYIESLSKNSQKGGGQASDKSHNCEGEGSQKSQKGEKEVPENSQNVERDLSELLGDLDASIFLNPEEKILNGEKLKTIKDDLENGKRQFLEIYESVERLKDDLKKRTQQFLMEIYKPVERSKVHGFDYDEKTLKMLLLNEKTQDSFKLIGVVGVLGVGKSTLCRLIFTEEEVKQHFLPRIWISMSDLEHGTMEKVVERMLEHLGVEDETIKSISRDHKLPGLLYALYLHLKGKRFLIVFDDVREIKFDEVRKTKDNYYKDLVSCLSKGHGFPKRDGGAVIVNSRKEKAINVLVGDQNLHRLLPLSDPDSCWKIYQNWDVSKQVKMEDKKAEGPGSIASKEVTEEAKQAVASGPPQDPGSSASQAITEDAKKTEGQDASKEGKQVESQTDVPKEVKEELTKKCGGIPLAAVMMREIKQRQKEQEQAEAALKK